MLCSDDGDRLMTLAIGSGAANAAFFCSVSGLMVRHLEKLSNRARELKNRPHETRLVDPLLMPALYVKFSCD